MKKLLIFFCALQCLLLTSCFRNRHDVSISYNDDARFYSMDAWYSTNKTKRTERYLNDMIGRDNHISFSHRHAEGLYTLDDGSKFYMKKSPGHIMIRVNKDESSDQSLHKIKDICRGMKDVVLR